ncbi:hypothetical protein N7466_009681 [Penicillium verhagenii]|uniref:uncharacterized protein n=1 Tax=Penicillium verhagenii TaxID=1562060 RepID=UPI002544F981|nr:uncharacterized protein N7466_009681 [Penicillium verhagenii]KAJ5921355.1 hypothetical protein N7466_009681 [Penicillium verhagenii]
MPSRPLLIPQKRPLITSKKPTDKGKPNTKKPTPKILNPSASAAETRMKKPTPYASDVSAAEYAELEDHTPEPIKVAFAMPVQPFLDPPSWEAMLKRAREAANTNTSTNTNTGPAGVASGSRSASGRQGNNERSAPYETADQRRQRQDREAEYGSMAIRGRSNISGRGKRVRGGSRRY